MMCIALTKKGRISLISMEHRWGNYDAKSEKQLNHGMTTYTERNVIQFSKTLPAFGLPSLTQVLE